jgi:hypothetical protein
MKLFCALFFGLIIFSVAHADYTSTSFQLENPVTVISGGESSSPNFRYFSSTGELTDAQSVSSSFTQNAGSLFYPLVYMPVVYPVGGDQSVDLTWSASQGFLGWVVSGYSVGISDTEGGPYNFTEVSGAVLRKNITNLSNNTRYYFIVKTKDILGNIIATSAEVSAVPTAPIQVNASSPKVEINNSQLSYTINVPATVTAPSINVSSISTASGENTVAAVVGSISSNIETSVGHLDVDIPAGANISGPSSAWDGVINLPQVKLNSSIALVSTPDVIATVSKAIEIGAGDVPLTISKAVRLLISGEAGKLVGYSTSGVFTKIQDICAEDSQSAGDALSDGGNCKINVGDDMVVWTKHFTVFITYTESPAGNGNGGGNNGGDNNNGNTNGSGSNNNYAGSGSGDGFTPTQTGVVFSGRAYPLSKVNILKDGQLVLATIAGPDSNFAATLNNLSSGSYTFSVYGEDKNGLHSSPLTFPIFITSGATINVSGIFIAPTIAVDKSDVKAGDNLVIFGQSAPLSQVVISVNSTKEFLKNTTSDKSGIYLYNFDTSVLEKGKHTLKSRALKNGEVSPYSDTVGFTVGKKNILTPSITQKSAKNSNTKTNIAPKKTEILKIKLPEPDTSNVKIKLPTVFNFFKTLLDWIKISPADAEK